MSGEALAPGSQGPMRLTDQTVKRGTTMAISTMNFLLVRGVLRRGDGLVTTPVPRVQACRAPVWGRWPWSHQARVCGL